MPSKARKSVAIWAQLPAVPCEVIRDFAIGRRYPAAVKRCFLPVVALAASILSPVLSTTAATLQAGDYVAICGDSITEQKTYSAYIEEYLIACQPAPDLQASQFGWGGETSWGFLERMENDVLRFKPNVATLCYGMNDGDYSKTKPDRLEQFTNALTGIVEKFKAAGVREIVVGSPGAVDTTSFKGALFRPSTPEEYNRTLSDFANAAKKVAQEQNVTYADLLGPMLEVMAKMKEKYGKDYLLIGDDGIHPKEAGHLIMAYAFLKALGCKGEIGTIVFDASKGQATASEGHKVLSASRNAVRLKSTRYPFCFEGDPAKPEATSGVIEFLPFNEDLNRFLLVIKNVPVGTKSVKVTWGTETREFTPAEVSKGINLAAEFLTNPFSGPFKQVHEAVLRQQRYETPMMKDLLHFVPEWKKNLGEQAAPFDDFIQNMITIDQELRKAAVASVVPVEHEIGIAFK